MLDGTLKKEAASYIPFGRFSFINPSLSDYLTYYFKNNEEERKKLLYSACSIEQFELYYEKFMSIEFESLSRFQGDDNWFADLLLKKVATLKCYQELKHETNREKYKELRASVILNRNHTNDAVLEKRVQEFILQAIKNYGISTINEESWKYYLELISDILSFTSLHEYLIKNWDEILTALFNAGSTIAHFEEVKALAMDYRFSFIHYLEKPQNLFGLECKLSIIVDDFTWEWVDDEKKTVKSHNDWTILKLKVERKRSDIFEIFNLADSSYKAGSYFVESDLEEIIAENLDRQREEEEKSLENKQIEFTIPGQHLVKEIELLFSGEYEENFVQAKAAELYYPF